MEILVNLIAVTLVTLHGLLFTSVLLSKTIKTQQEVAKGVGGIGARSVFYFWITRMGLEFTSVIGSVIMTWVFYSWKRPDAAEIASCWALIVGVFCMMIEEVFKLIQFVLEHRLWWCTSFTPSLALLLWSQAITSTTTSKYLLLVAVVIHRVLCSVLFLWVPLNRANALIKARHLVVPQQLLLLLLLPTLCFMEMIHAEIYLYIVFIISKAVMEWKNITHNVLGLPRLRQLSTHDAENATWPRMHAGIRSGIPAACAFPARDGIERQRNLMMRGVLYRSTGIPSWTDLQEPTPAMDENYLEGPEEAVKLADGHCME